MDFPILTTILAIPCIGGLLCLMLHKDNVPGARAVAFVASFAALVAALPLYGGFKALEPGYQFLETHAWIPDLGVQYRVGADGISLFLVLLTVVLTPLALLSTWRSVGSRVREFAAAILFLEAGMIGVFIALDLFLFYVFWEAMLIPMYLLIGVWGGENRRYAALKFILYTVVGSVLMLVAILYLYARTGAESFELEAIVAGARQGLSPTEQAWLFAAFALAFAVKVPLFPLHTWLPDAHVEAPTAGSVILAGVLLKMGVYGFLRFAMPIFPEVFLAWAPWLAVLSLVGIVYGAFLALAQSDIKKLVAYSSVSHLGYVMLGLAAGAASAARADVPAGVTAVSGGLYQCLSHGVSTGALFLLVGVLYERRHTRDMDRFGGIAAQAPVLATVFMIITLSSIGLPGLNGFVGEFLILQGSFLANPWWAVVGGLGIVLGAVYMLRMMQRVFFGKDRCAASQGSLRDSLPDSQTPFLDLTPRELVALAPLVALAFLLGLYPGFILDRMEPAIETLLRGMVR